MTHKQSQGGMLQGLARKLRGVFSAGDAWPGAGSGAGSGGGSGRGCNDRGLLVFEHTGEVISAERLLRKAGMDVEVKGPPPQLRTGCDMVPATVGELSIHANIIGIKEARAEEDRMEALLPLRREDFAVLSGDDPTAVRAMLAGADGVISVASNVVPATFRRLCDRARAGDAAGAQVLDGALAELYHFLGVEPNPIPVKALLALDGIGHGLRLPLQPLSSAHVAQAQRLHTAIRQLEERSRADAA